MSRCAEHARRAARLETAALSVEARIERALALGESDLEIFASASGLTLAEARESLRRRREEARHRGRVGAGR